MIGLPEQMAVMASDSERSISATASPTSYHWLIFIILKLVQDKHIHEIVESYVAG